MQRRLRRVLAIGMCFAAFAAGCTPYSTYPKHSGSGQFTGPRTFPVPQLMAQAIAETAEKNKLFAPPGAQIVFDLPAGTPPEVYSDVTKLIDRPARPMRVSDEPAIHVEIVRVRALKAEVDVIYPINGGLYEMTTLFLERGMVGQYTVMSTRRWHMRIEPPAARFTAATWPPEKTLAKQPADPIE